MPESLSISEARSRLPQIAQSLVREPGSVVYIEHRDMDERLAVTTESHLRYLETMVSQLKRRAAQPFTLAGSIQSELSPAQLAAEIAAVRAAAAAEQGERLKDL